MISIPKSPPTAFCFEGIGTKIERVPIFFKIFLGLFQNPQKRLEKKNCLVVADIPWLRRSLTRQKVPKYTQKRVFCIIPLSLGSVRCGSVLWVSKVSYGHPQVVSKRFCTGLPTSRWIMSEKPGFQEYLENATSKSSSISENLKNFPGLQRPLPQKYLQNLFSCEKQSNQRRIMGSSWNHSFSMFFLFLSGWLFSMS